MDDFDFIEHCGWLKPFITGLVAYYGIKSDNETDDDSTDSIDSNDCIIKKQRSSNENIFKYSGISFCDANQYAIYNLDKVFKNDCFSKFCCNTYSWLECVDKGNDLINIKCRVSHGFDNKNVPITKRFNPIFNSSKYREEYLLALHSYKYLYYRHEIETMIKTPSSDYTRFNHETPKNILNKFFMMNLRIIQSKSSNPNSIENILTTYQSKSSNNINSH